MKSSAVIKPINAEVLQDWPLPLPSHRGDKEERGRVLIIGGSREMPGAVMLAATAALRAGAGKVTIATSASIAQAVALAIPETRVIGLEETPRNGIAPLQIEALISALDQCDTVLVGPGMQDEASAAELTKAILCRLGQQSIVLDAFAMTALPLMQSTERAPVRADHTVVMRRAEARILLTPHAGEMAHLMSMSKDDILANPGALAGAAARRWNVLVALKGATTFIASPHGPTWRHDGGNIGLAVSGSGDTLAGLIAGLAARGASLEQAGAWGVTLHARAGDILAERFGPLGYLASEIAAEIPRLMHAIGAR